MNFSVLVRHSIASLALYFLSILVLGGLFPKIITGVGFLLHTPFDYICSYKTSPYALSFQDLEKLEGYMSAHIYFHARISTTLDHPYNILASGACLVPLTKQEASKKIIQERLEKLQVNRNLYKQILFQVPDFITASSSGLDPHITFSNASFQAARIAQARKVDVKEIQGMLFDMMQHTSSHEWALFPRVLNVIQLNQELDTRFSVEKDS